MKKLKIVCSILAMLVAMAAISSCFMINAQKMKNVKGTYQLTHYTYAPDHDADVTVKTINYIEDRGYEVYLVVTGENEGYYVHKDNQNAAHSREVQLSYDYDAEEPSKVSYVKYRDSLNDNTSDGWSELGVTKDALNYSKPAITLFGRVTSAVDQNWKKVDDATDLSYVKEKLGAIQEYEYEAYSYKGVYELTSYEYAQPPEETPDSSGTPEVAENPYQYYFIAMETANNEMKATVYYALKSDRIAKVESMTLSLLNGWSKLQIGAKEWDIDPLWQTYYYHVTSAEKPIRETLTCISRDITQKNVEELIAAKMPSEPVE